MDYRNALNTNLQGEVTLTIHQHDQLDQNSSSVGAVNALNAVVEIHSGSKSFWLPMAQSFSLSFHQFDIDPAVLTPSYISDISFFLSEHTYGPHIKYYLITSLYYYCWDQNQNLI